MGTGPHSGRRLGAESVTCGGGGCACARDTAQALMDSGGTLWGEPRGNQLAKMTSTLSGKTRCPAPTWGSHLANPFTWTPPPPSPSLRCCAGMPSRAHPCSNTHPGSPPSQHPTAVPQPCWGHQALEIRLRAVAAVLPWGTAHAHLTQRLPDGQRVLGSEHLALTPPPTLTLLPTGPARSCSCGFWWHKSAQCPPPRPSSLCCVTPQPPSSDAAPSPCTEPVGGLDARRT